MGSKIFKIQTDFVNIFIFPPRKNQASSCNLLAVAHPFTMFMFDGNLIIYLKFMENFVFFTFHEYVVCFSNRSHAN